MSRSLGIQKKFPASTLPKNDPKGQLSAAELNKLVAGVEESELEGTAEKLINEKIGDPTIDLALRYKLSKEK